LSERLTRQGEPVVLLHQTIKDRVGDGGVAHPGMPVLDRQLAVMMVALLAARSSTILSRYLGNQHIVSTNPCAALVRFSLQGGMPPIR
jgi:hypothetical protein